MERLRELCKEYQFKDICNMDKSGCFFKTLPTKGLARKGKKNVKMEESQSKKWQLRFSLVPMVVKLASQYYPEIKKSRLL